MAATAVTPHQRPESRWAEAVGRVVLARTATVRPAHPERHNRGRPDAPALDPTYVAVQLNSATPATQFQRLPQNDRITGGTVEAVCRIGRSRSDVEIVDPS